MRCGKHIGLCIGQQRAPFRSRRLNAQRQEGKAGSGEDHVGDIHGGRHNNGPQCIGNDIFEDDAHVAGTVGSGGLYVILIYDAQHHGTNQTQHAGHAGDGNGDQQISKASAQRGYHSQAQQNRRYGHHHVRQAHDDIIYPAAVIGRDSTQQAADDQRQYTGGNTDQQRIAGAMDNAGKQVAPQLVCAEYMCGTGAVQTVGALRNGVFVGGDHIGEDGDAQDKNQKTQTQHGRLALAETAPYFLHLIGFLALAVSLLFHFPSPPCQALYFALIRGSM